MTANKEKKQVPRKVTERQNFIAVELPPAPMVPSHVTSSKIQEHWKLQQQQQTRHE